MRTSPGVHFDADTYALIIGSLAKLGHFCVGAKAIDGTSDAGFAATHGPSLFDQLANEMAEDILELTEPAAKHLLNSFATGFSIGSIDSDGDIPTLRSGEETKRLPLTVGRVEIDGTTALCPVTGATLRLIALDEDQRQHVHDTLIKMAGIQFVEFTKNRRKPIEENLGILELARFSKWME